MFEAFYVRVDFVLMGKGTSNTGNVAKRCLENYEKLAKALELDVTFVKNLYTILLLFGLKEYTVDMAKLRELCESTNELFYTKYEWAKMRPSVHKLLKHGPDIAENFDLPQAYYAEDGTEHLHKILKDAFGLHTCQRDRTTKIGQTFKYGLSNSIPHISLKGIEQRQTYKRKKPFPSHVYQYLVDPSHEMQEDEMDLDTEDIDLLI